VALGISAGATAPFAAYTSYATAVLSDFCAHRSSFSQQNYRLLQRQIESIDLTIGVGAQSTLAGGTKFLPEKYVLKISKMPEFYMILARKMPEFYIIIA